MTDTLNANIYVYNLLKFPIIYIQRRTDGIMFNEVSVHNRLNTNGWSNPKR